MLACDATLLRMAGATAATHMLPCVACMMVGGEQCMAWWSMTIRHSTKKLNFPSFGCFATKIRDHNLFLYICCQAVPHKGLVLLDDKSFIRQLHGSNSLMTGRSGTQYIY
jgi:hypothetical protein